MMARLVAALLAVSVAAGCASADPGTPPAGGQIAVVAAFYPLRFLSAQIGGTDVTVTDLAKPGAEPHDIELSPRQVARISDAALVVYLKGFQPAVDQAVDMAAQRTAFDVGTAVPLLPYAEGEDEGGSHDPHVWLDPVRYAAIATAVGAKLAAADPAHATGYAARTADLRARLQELDGAYARALRGCARREIVTSHTAFRYLAQRYGLTEIGITGITPDAEPAPRQLIHATEQARAAGATTIFFETLVSPKVAETVARSIGARAAVLDPLEGVTTPGDDYFTVMRANLAALTSALGCAP